MPITRPRSMLEEKAKLNWNVTTWDVGSSFPQHLSSLDGAALIRPSIHPSPAGDEMRRTAMGTESEIHPWRLTRLRLAVARWASCLLPYASVQPRTLPCATVHNQWLFWQQSKIWWICFLHNPAAKYIRTKCSRSSYPENTSTYFLLDHMPTPSWFLWSQ
jgi:hypothetical protein